MSGGLGVHDAEKATRGGLAIAAPVVEKVASAVASGADGVGAPAPSARRRGARDLAGGPRVSATVVGGVADLQVEVAARYPDPVALTMSGLRERLATRVPRLAGVRVRRIDISVTEVVRDE